MAYALVFLSLKLGGEKTLNACVLLTRTSHVTDARAQRHGKHSFGSSEDIDSVWRKYPPSLCLLDVYILKIVPLQRLLLLRLVKPSPCSSCIPETVSPCLSVCSGSASSSAVCNNSASLGTAELPGAEVFPSESSDHLTPGFLPTCLSLFIPSPPKLGPSTWRWSRYSAEWLSAIKNRTCKKCVLSTLE